LTGKGANVQSTSTPLTEEIMHLVGAAFTGIVRVRCLVFSV